MNYDLKETSKKDRLMLLLVKKFKKTKRKNLKLMFLVLKMLSKGEML